MTQRFGKWPKYLGNGSDICEMAEIYGARFKYLRYGIGMLQMT